MPMHAAVTFIAKYFIILALLGALAVWLRLKNKQKLEAVAVLIVGGIITYALAKIGGHFFYDTRPFVAGHFTPYFSHGADNGFPSDHTLLAGLLAWTAFCYRKRAGVALLVLAAIIGLSRVIAGVHHLADIVGSLIFSAIGVWIAWQLIKLFTKHRAPARHKS
jgi:undecaprenyl-diphosphatase